MDNEIIAKAKQIAQKDQMSLSMMVERYFTNLTSLQKSKDKKEIGPITQTLSGSVKNNTQKNYKRHIEDYLIGKYIK